MKKETYLKLREQFLKQYSQLSKNELGFVKLKEFKIRNFKTFIFLFSLDYVDCSYNNNVSLVESKGYVIRNRRVTSIKINSNKSMFDKFNQFDNAVKFLKL